MIKGCPCKPDFWVKSKMVSLRKFNVLLILPLEVQLNFMLIVPFALAIYLSLTNWSLIQPNILLANWLGGLNYLILLQDKQFHAALLRTVTIMAAAIPIEFLLGLGIALSFNRRFRGKRIFIAILLTPMMILPVVTGLTFLVLFFRNGAINQILSIITQTTIALDWLTTPNTALLAVILTDVWQWTPFMFLIIYAGLTSLPEEPNQAARIFGASGLKLFRHVTFPQLRNILLIALVIRSLELFKLFDVPFVLTAGGPGTATETVSIYFFLTAIKQGQLSYTAALALVTMSLIVIVSLFATRPMLPKSVKIRKKLTPDDNGRPETHETPLRTITSLATQYGVASKIHRPLSSSEPRPIDRNIRRRYRRRYNLGPARHVVWYLYISVLSFLALLPVFWLVATSFKNRPEWFVNPPVWITPNPAGSNYLGLFFPVANTPGAVAVSTAMRPIINSLIIAAGATAIATIVGFLAAYSISRYKTGGAGLLFFTLTTRMLPPIAILIPLLAFLTSLGLFDTQAGLILINSTVTVAFVIWMMKTFIDEFPREIEEAAMMEGMSNWGILFKMVMPLVRGGIVAAAFFVFILVWSEFLAALTMSSIDAVPITVQLTKYRSAGGTIEVGQMSALSTIAIIPVLAFAYAIQKHLVRGLTFGAVKGK